MKCIHCGHETAVNATVCSQCGANPPHGGAQAPNALVAIVGTILGVFVLGKFFGVW
jgi:hypothetical protein